MDNLNKGGRPLGSKNKATVELKAAFKKHGRAFVTEILKLTRHEDASIRLKALAIAFERGWGRPAQQLELTGEVAVARIERVIIDDARVIDADPPNDKPEQLVH